MKDSVYILKTYIERQSSGELLEETFTQRRIQGKEVEALMAEIPISELPTGDYNLVFELRSARNELVEAKKGFFQRLNRNKRFDESAMYSLNYNKTFVDTMTEKLLRSHVGCLRPIAEQNERTYIDELLRDKKKPDYDRMRRFIYSFWYSRNQSNPAEEWKKFHEQVIVCNQKFGSKIMRGYEMERGRVFLQYGPPNSRTVVDNEPSAYPYEIWWYYTLKRQNNVRFVFYNPDLVSNDYRLIHSEAFAEPFDPQWKLLIYSRTNPINNVDQTNQREHFGNFIDQNFRNQ
jgi:GWxTD domain-containing protein